MTKIKKMARYLHKNHQKLHTRQSLMKALKCSHSSSMGGNWVGNYLLRAVKGGVLQPLGHLEKREVFRLTAFWAESYIHKCLSKGDKNEA